MVLNPFSKHPRFTVLALMGVGLALRLWFVSVNQLEPVHSPADDGDYYQRALRFATTGEYLDDFWLIRPPLHVFLFALMLKISIVLGNVPGIPLVRAAQIALSILAIPTGYALARRLYGVRAGLVFAGILAAWYPLVELPAHFFTEPLFLFLFLAHLWLLVVWRDTHRWTVLAGAGVLLGLTALTRSVAVYGIPFVVVWLALEVWSHTRAHPSSSPPHPPASPFPPADPQPTRPLLARAFLGKAFKAVLVFLVSAALVILPWTARNYVVYQRFILIDTIGSVNLWLHMEKYEEKGVEVLKTMPQRDRQVFAVADTRRMFLEDPAHFWHMLWRNAWPHFLHIWKAQFLEDFLLKSSFYGRPLRAMWPLGVAGDIMWLVFTAGGLAALVAPLREGMFRWLALCWSGYTVLTVMLFHVEPRYLMPLWVILALSSSWVWGDGAGFLALLRRRWLNGVLALVLVGGFLGICFSYRDYPEAIAHGIRREYHHTAGVRAYQEGRYDQAVREFQAALDAQPHVASSRAYLALALVARGHPANAQEVAGSDDAQHALVARGAAALAQGERSKAARLLTKAEKKPGEDVQAMTLAWLLPPPTTHLDLGSGHDFGYIEGFSLAEQTETSNAIPYRWLQGRGRVVLPLPEPLQPGSTVALRLAGNQTGYTPLRVGLISEPGSEHHPATISVVGGQWRVYRLAVPASLEGQERLEVTLEAPIFIPAHDHSGSNDIRPLSLMVSAVWVQ